MSDGLLSHVGLGERPANVVCQNRNCGRPLTPDVGLTVEGFMGGWAKCHKNRGGCGMVTCAMGRHLIRNPRAMAWADGITEGDGSSVPVCMEGCCGRLYEQMERAIVAFRYPDGVDAAQELADMRERAKGGEDSWLAICARAMIRVWEYEKFVKPELRRRRQEEILAGMASAAKTHQQYLADQRARQEANAARVRAAQRAFSEAGVDIFCDGLDEDMARAVKLSLAAEVIESIPPELGLDNGVLADTALRLAGGAS